MQLEKKVIVITGGAQGIGFTMAKMLAGRGARVVLVDMNGEQLDSATAELKALGCEAYSYVANVAKEDDVVSLFDQLTTDLGQLNGLINNAGITRDGLLIKADHGEVRKKVVSRRLAGSYRRESDWGIPVRARGCGAYG